MLDEIFALFDFVEIGPRPHFELGMPDVAGSTIPIGFHVIGGWLNHQIHPMISRRIRLRDVRR